MRNFLRRLGDNFRSFMYGRYGFDTLGRFLIVVALVLIMISKLLPEIPSAIVSVLAWGVLIWAYIRFFSKKLGKRMVENEKFCASLRRIRNYFSRLFDKNYRYFKCPGCGKKVKVPRHRGKIEITCKNCGFKFEKYTGKRI